MDGYAGERNGIVLLAGVPDRPESLPHNALHVPAESEAKAPPMHRVRQRLIAIAEREGMLEREQQALATAARDLGVEPQLHDNDRFLLTAYCTLGARSAQGTTALELLDLRELDIEERAVVNVIEQGRFAVLRIQHIQLDEGMEVSDVLSRRKLHIRERSATRHVAIGDLLLGWICDVGGGDWTLEGGVVHVPARADSF